jgi:hypothetical protein
MGKTKILMPVLFTVLAVTGCSTQSTSTEGPLPPPPKYSYPHISFGSSVTTNTGLERQPAVSAQRLTESQIREHVSIRNMTTSVDITFTISDLVDYDGYLTGHLDFIKTEGWYRLIAKPVMRDGGALTSEVKQDWYTYSKPMFANLSMSSKDKKTRFYFTERVYLAGSDVDPIVVIIDGVENSYVPHQQDDGCIYIDLYSIPSKSFIIKLPGAIRGVGGENLLKGAEGTSFKVEDGYVVVDAMPDSWVMDGVFYKYFR